MNDKTMPKRIWLVPSDYSERTLWTAKAVDDPDEAGQAAYIRTDLVPAPSAGEPLEDGQYRWVEIGGQWIAGKISGSTKHNLYFYDVDGNETPVAALGGIGPVIRPPADTTD